MLLLDEAADGAGDEDVTPAEIADEVTAALEQAGGPAADPRARRLLHAALDAVSDGLPADDVTMILRDALSQLDAAASS